MAGITSLFGIDGRAVMSWLTTIHALVAYAARKFPLLAACVLLSLISVAMELAAMTSLVPLTELAVGHVIPSTSTWSRIPQWFGHAPDIAFYMVLFWLLISLRLITSFASSVLVSYLSRQMIAHFSSEAFTAFVNLLAFEEIQQRSVGYFINLAGDEANRASQVITALLRLIPVAMLGLLYFSALAYQSWWVAMGVLAFLALSLAALGQTFRKVHELGACQQQESRDLNSHFLDSLNSLRTVRSYTAEGFVSQEYQRMIYGYARTCFRIDALSLLSSFVPALILVLVSGAAILWMIDVSALAAYVSVIMVAVVLLLRFFPVAGQAIDIFLRLVADLRAGDDLRRVLRDVSSRKVMAPVADECVIAPPIHHIRFETVSFAYPQREPVLQAFTVSFCAGNNYAVLGRSGIGKSTFVDVLLKFYVPHSGRITVNDVDLCRVNTQWLRDRIRVVEQHAKLFNDTIYHNVAFGAQVTLDVVREACRIACIDSDIERLSEGYNTLVTYQGGNLSGGQRQRLAIARALVRNPDVLILDESVNALDTALRRQVMTSILHAYRQRIVICITHDPAVSEQFERVLDFVRLKAEPQPLSS
ncbi:MAG: ABC transporter ATP-binding protein [Nitrospira sp.]|nr:ABC transporter ATP-binding protein [Nitrospira sp.]